MPDPAYMRVMIVDDQESMLALLRSHLHQLGYKNLVECIDGKEALDLLLLGQSVDLIISDMYMPNLDGLALLSAIRREAELQQIPFIMVSSRAEEAVVKQAQKLGVNGYLMKPFSLAQFKRKIETVVAHLD